MDPILITIVIVLAIASLILLVLLFNANSDSRRELSAQSASIGMLQQQLEGLKTSQDTSGTTIEKNLQTGQKNITDYLQTSQKALLELHTQLGELKGSSQQMLNLGTDVRKLQDILKSPKLRGQLGEKSLENLLATILPANSFQLQYRFKNGKIVDAIAQMPDYIVPIDAKFPLPSFEAMITAESDDAKAKLRRQFQADVTKHIDKIADSYINPDQQTLDFALMYIPAENVYYETIVKYATDRTDILNYALERKVIPVSPNLLYAYLMTVVMGLHGMKIEKQAATIRQNLNKISTDFQNFNATWDLMGKHLQNAQNQFDTGSTKLNKFSMQLNQIKAETNDQPE